MGTMITNFADTAIGSRPAGWAPAWAAATPTVNAVIEDATAYNGKVFARRNSNNVRWAEAWTDAGQHVQWDLRARIKMERKATNDIRFLGRIQGSAAAETGGMLEMYGGTEPEPSLIIRRYVGGTLTTSDSEPFTWDAGVWYQLHFTMNNGEWFGSAWKDEIETEPAIPLRVWSWTTDPILTAGYAGFGGYPLDNQVSVDVFSVGWDGDDAPLISRGGGITPDVVTINQLHGFGPVDDIQGSPNYNPSTKVFRIDGTIVRGS